MARSTHLFLAMVLLIAFAHADCPTAQAVQPVEGSDRATRLEAACAEIQERKLSVLITVAHADQPLYIREFGALRDDGIEPENTQIDLNSITKTVTGVMICKLVELNKARFDETLREIFDDVPDDKAAITIHQLLTHAAGFPEAVGSDEEELSRDEFLARAFGADLLHRPGARYAYSNTGFGILAAIIEVRTGATYEQFLRASVLPRGEFQNIGYASIYDESRALRTRRGRTIYQASWGGHDASWHLVGNGGLVATAPEFVRFRKLVTAGNIIPPNLVSLVHQPHIKESADGRSHYGYGLVVQEHVRAGRYYWHDGGNGVYSAQWNDFRDQNDILFTAGTGDGATTAMSLLVNKLYPRKKRSD